MPTQYGQPKVLLFFPHDLSDRKSGVNVRLSMIFDYLKSLRFQIDLLSLKNFGRESSSQGSMLSHDENSRKILFDHAKGLRYAWIRNLIHLDFIACKNLLGKKVLNLPDYAFPGLHRLFQRLLQENSYDFVIIGYVQWARLLERCRQRNFRAIITIEDCLTDNLIQNGTDRRLYDSLLAEEVRRLELFDDAVCISYEEMEMFAAKTRSLKYHFIPVFLNPCLSPENSNFEFDLLFVGSDHPSNKRGIAWFFTNVYPLLPEGTRILCVGKIVRYIDDYPDVTKITFVEDITGVYSRSRIAIIPLLDGTGMKVKLIESLAHGVPVVTTTAGLSGIPEKLKKSFITADEPMDFAEAAVNLVTDQQFYKVYSGNLRKLFTEEFSTEAVTSRLDRIFLKES